MYTLYLILLYLSIDSVILDPILDRVVPEYQEWLYWSTNRYKIYGEGLGQRPCINNCIKDRCVSEYRHRDLESWHKSTQPCSVNSNITTHVYFTSRHRAFGSFCFSRCGKFGYDYNWCLVYENGAGVFEWDFCSSEIYEQTYKVHLTTDTNTRCTTTCKLNDGTARHLPLHTYMCKDPFEVTRQCNPYMTVDYIPHWTIFGDICVSNCTRENNCGHYICYDINSKHELCAPTAQKFGSHTRDMYYLLYKLDELIYKDVKDISKKRHILYSERVCDSSYQIPYY